MSAMTELCSTMGHETIPATSRVRLGDCEDDPCSGHPYCHDCVEVLATDYDNDVVPTEGHCPTCGHAVKVVGDTTKHYEPTGCLRIEDDHQVCDEQLHHLRSLLTRVSDWFDNPNEPSSELVELINEALA